MFEQIWGKIQADLNSIKQLQAEEKKIVFTNGCFDLLHPGHIDYLSKAKKLGDVLIVGLNSDESIRLLKGAQRPINDLFFRYTLLNSLACVDFVIPFKEETPLNLILKIQPNILVKGGDYHKEQIVGAKEIVSYGGSIEIIPFLAGYSSSNLIDKIKSLT